MSNHQEPWNNQQRPLGQPFKYVSIILFIPINLFWYTNNILFFFLVVNIPQCYPHQQRWSKVCFWDALLLFRERGSTNEPVIYRRTSFLSLTEFAKFGQWQWPPSTWVQHSIHQSCKRSDTDGTSMYIRTKSWVLFRVTKKKTTEQPILTPNV